MVVDENERKHATRAESNVHENGEHGSDNATRFGGEPVQAELGLVVRVEASAEADDKLAEQNEAEVVANEEHEGASPGMQKENDSEGGRERKILSEEEEAGAPHENPQQEKCPR